MRNNSVIKRTVLLPLTMIVLFSAAACSSGVVTDTRQADIAATTANIPSAKPQDKPARIPEHILVFSDDDKKAGLDKTLMYTADDIILIEEAEKLQSEKNYEESDKLYQKLASINPAFQRDPLLLMNWGIIQTQLGQLTDAHEKLSASAEKAGAHPDLSSRLHDAMLLLRTKMPDSDEFRSRKLQLLKDAYNLDKNDAASGLELASAYLSSSDAPGSIERIKQCINSVDASSGQNSANPFFWFVKGLISQYEGDIGKAVKYVRKAEKIASNNRDIALWLKAYDPGVKDPGNNAAVISLESLKLDAEGFNTYDGLLWLDDSSILVTTYKNEKAAGTQNLLLLNTGTLEFKQIYKGVSIKLEFVTPDRKFAAVNDNGLKLVDLNSGEVREISVKGWSCSLSPDGKTIAYDEDGIWLYDIDHGTKKKIDSGRDDTSPIWFPDGKNLLFIGDLGGAELGDGAGHLQGIFSIPVNPLGKRLRIAEEWKSKFHYIKWIKAGEILHVEEGWDDGFNSLAYYLSSDYKKQLGSINDGEALVYREGDADGLFILNGEGGVTRMDVDGRTLSKYDFGNIWGDSCGTSFTNLKVLSGSGMLMFTYGTVLSDEKSLWVADFDMEKPVFVAEISKDFSGTAVVSPSGTRVATGIRANALQIVELKK